MVPNEIELMARGMKLTAKVWGPEDGPRLLALHGWLDNANSYDVLAPLLPEWRIVALDFPGHGHSQHRSPDASYHFLDYAIDVCDVADELGWKDFALVGHSMGAAVGCILAGAYPERVSHLVLIDALGPTSSEADEMPDRFVKHMTEERRRRTREPRPLADRETATELLYSVVPRLSRENAARLVERATRDVPGGVTWTYDARLRGTSTHRLTQAQVMAFMKRITCPVLFVRATDGMAFNEANMAARKLAVATLTTVEMTGGHHVHMERAPEVAAHMRAFLTQ